MADVFEAKKDIVFAWFEKTSGESVDGFDSLKSGVVLCKAVNALRANTIKDVSNYKAAFRQMKNIDNWIRVADKVGVTGKDKCRSEDLFYENNLPKFVLTAVLFINACAAKFGCDGVSSDGIDELRAYSAGTAVKGGKVRAGFTGLGIFDTDASKHQKYASKEARVKDRLVKEDMQDMEVTAELGYMQADQVKKQKMISKAKAAGTDLIIMSTEEAEATSHLGMFGSDQVTKQKMISKAKAAGTDLIIMSTEQAEATADLGMFGSDQVTKQKMISKAKAAGTDLIIMSTEEAEATADLGMFGSDQVDKQKMISEAKSDKLDLIIKNQGADGGDDDDIDF